MGAAISICGRKEDVEASSLVAIIPTDAVPDDDSDASSDTTSSWESDNEEAYEFAWETVDIIFELACSTLESQGGAARALHDAVSRDRRHVTSCGGAGWKQTAIGAAKRQVRIAAIFLHTRYAMSGTDLCDAATRQTMLSTTSAGALPTAFAFRSALCCTEHPKFFQV